MPRMDVWDADPQAKREVPRLGYRSGLDKKYSLGDHLGAGGFGSVRAVEHVASGNKFACKSIKKRLDIPVVSQATTNRHLENIKREITVLHRLRGTLNVVHLEEVYEDDEYVHIIMELCTGGELVHAIGSRHYSERTAASYMRGVLRTLAQCHHHRILHRDVKPGNFMLLHERPDAALKAIDFGLAVMYHTKDLPLTNLGLEGTPWYMSPEMLSSQVGPESDVWAAGVMAYQLLSGNFPFNDWKNTKNPALSRVWRSILMEEPKMSGAAWSDISEPAKDFVRTLLNKDPKSRPTAQQALKHPWLHGGPVQRAQGKPLASTVVQKLQKFGTEHFLKRTVLDMIANELLQRHTTAKAPPAASAQLPGTPPGMGVRRRISSRQLAAQDYIRHLATKCATVHSGQDAHLMMHGPTTSPTDSTLQPDSAISPSKRGLRDEVVDSLPPGAVDMPSSKAEVGSEANRFVVSQNPRKMSKITSQASLAHYAFLVGAGAAAASLERTPLDLIANDGQSPPLQSNPSGHSLKHAALISKISGVQPSNHSSLDLSPSQGSPLMTGFQGSGAGSRGGSTYSGDEAQKLLNTLHGGVHDHRKVQRLSLDLSGRGQQLYKDVQAGPCKIYENQLPTMLERDASLLLEQNLLSPAASHSGTEGDVLSTPECLSEGDAAEVLVEEERHAGAGSPPPPTAVESAPMLVLPSSIPSPIKSAAGPEDRGRGQGAYAALMGLDFTATSSKPAAEQQQQQQQEQEPRRRSSGLLEGAVLTPYINVLHQVHMPPARMASYCSAPVQHHEVPPTSPRMRPSASTSVLRNLRNTELKMENRDAILSAPIHTSAEWGHDGGQKEDGAGEPQLEVGEPQLDTGGPQLEAVRKGVDACGLSMLMGPGELSQLAAVLSSLHYDSSERITCEELSEGLKQMGYQLEPSEVELLLRDVASGSDNNSTITQARFIASQVDWREFEANHREEWLACLKKTFEGLDSAGSGRISTDDVLKLLNEKLPEDEVNLAIQEMLMDTALGEDGGLEFDDFVDFVGNHGRTSPTGSMESLDLYDSRLEHSGHQLDHYHPALDTVSEGQNL